MISLDPSAREVLLGLDDVDLDQFTRQRSGDEHHPTVVGTPHGVAARDESIGPDGQLHRSSVWQRVACRVRPG